MTRTIKARDIRPGMTIRWGEGDISHQCPLAGVERFNNDQDVQGETPQGQIALLHGDEDVLVVKESPQPEEPTEFGAKVRVREGQFVRLDEPGFRFRLWYEMGTGRRLTWDELCEMGPVTVVPDQGWAVPEDTPEVPERAEEWDTWEDVPKGVAVTTPGLFCHYRKNQGVVEVSYPKENPDWMKCGIRYMSHRYAPWTRVTNA